MFIFAIDKISAANSSLLGVDHFSPMLWHDNKKLIYSRLATASGPHNRSNSSCRQQLLSNDTI